MSFVNFIINLRKKPEHIRKRILIIAIIPVVLIIGYVWFYSLKLSLSSSLETSNENTAKSEIIKQESLKSPLADIKNQLSQMNNFLQQGARTIKDKISKNRMNNN